jgi:hypothetical protein
MNGYPPAWLALAFVLSACAGEEAVVTVSGAVARPGRYAHRPEWTADDYVEAAGGYTAEAVASEGKLIRVRRDSVTNEEANRSWWPLASSPLVRAGDVILVPFRTYAVRMDTVWPLEDLTLRWQDREYRVPRGWLAEGRTSAGVMVAAVIGEGTVVGNESGDTLGRFQYLYLHLHPAVYDELAMPVGSPDENSLLLEDALGIHQSIFSRVLHRSGERAEMPPEGYFRVIAGVWPKPRSKTMPGSGIRKRKYRDGREWTTFPDGRQRMVFPDGRVEMELPDGSREKRLADGRVEATDLKGDVLVTHPDGRIAATFADGNREERFADGRIVQRFKTGTKRTIFPDGREQTRFADGTLHVKRKDGTVEMTFPEGMRETRHADGRRVAVTREGHRVTVFPNGRRLTRTVDGTVLEEFADGVRLETFPDGRRSQSDAEGNHVEEFPDGTQVKTFVNAYRYWGPLESNLVEVDDTPERLPPGVRLQVAGAVRSDLEGMLAAVFRLPDGNVFEIPVEREKKRFHCVFPDSVFAASGHYRVQVRAQLTRGSVVAEDRPLVVGDPRPLGKMVLTVMPFRGADDARNRLSQMIHTARSRLELPVLEAHPKLMESARAKLWDVLSSGAFTSERAHGGAESFARGPSVEEVYTFMMLSGAHRKAILSKEWTHWGVSVQQDGGDILVVMVFDTT